MQVDACISRLYINTWILHKTVRIVLIQESMVKVQVENEHTAKCIY